MSSKYAVVAAQAVGVAALATVVYLAFLSPGSPGPLREIQVEDGVTVEAPDRHGRDGDKNRHRGENAKPRPHRAAPALPALPTLTLVNPSPTPATPQEPDGPAGSQYASAVTRIAGNVARGAP